MSWLKNLQETMYKDIVDQKTNAAYLDNAERLKVYGEGYFLRIHDVLITDFALTHWVLGPKKFEQLARDFISAHPSHEYNINSWGKDFAGFIKSHFLIQEYPFLAELAGYEWSLGQSQFFPRKTPADFTQYQSVSMEKWVDAKFDFQPNLILAHTQWAFDGLHHAFTDKKTFHTGLIVQQPTYFVFYQKEDGSYSSSIEEHEYKTLSLLMSGSSLGDVFETMEDENMVQSVFGWFQKWQEKELIINVHFQSHESE